MKRLPLRELLFVTAPVGMIGLGIWAAQLREQKWPTSPRISCTVNPPTPLQLWQGADVGVTAIGIIPNSFPQANKYSMEYSLIGQTKRIGDGADSYSGTNGYNQYETNCAYNKEELASLLTPLTVEVSLHANDKKPALIKQRFTLPTQGIIPPDIATVQQTNFRATKISLYLDTILPAPPPNTWNLIISLTDVNSQVTPSPTSHKSTCLDLSLFQNHKITKIPITGVSTSIPDNIPSLVDIKMNLSAWKRPFPKGTKIICTLAVAAGWPQIIEAEWPDFPTLNGTPKELKFTTRLAPLPPTQN